jgi:hypothetical protein
LLIPFILAICLAMTNAVNADDAVMKIETASPEISAPGETFTVNITITNAVNRWGWSCVVSWNSSVVNCTNKELGPFNPSGTTLLGVIKNDLGKIPMLTAGTTEEATVTGDGVVAILTFIATDVGDVDLNVTEAMYIDYPNKDTFDMTVQQAVITVVPEFPAAMIILWFLIATAAIAILAKRGWSKRFQGYVNA